MLQREYHDVSKSLINLRSSFNCAVIGEGLLAGLLINARVKKVSGARFFFTVLFMSSPSSSLRTHLSPPPLRSSSTTEAAGDLTAPLPTAIYDLSLPSLIPIGHLAGDSSPPPPTPPNRISPTTCSVVPHCRLARHAQPATTAGSAAAPGPPSMPAGHGCLAKSETLTYVVAAVVAVPRPKPQLQRSRCWPHRQPPAPPPPSLVLATGLSYAPLQLAAHACPITIWVS